MDGLERVWDSGRRASRNLGRSLSRSVGNFEADDVFTLASSTRRRSSVSRRGHVDEDEEALRWAALERLPTYDRLRKGILKSMVDGDGGISGHRPNFVHREVDVRNLGDDERQEFIQSVFKIADEDNERFLKKLRNRIEKVGISLPTVEVRFQNITIDAKCHTGGRALPTLLNTALNSCESLIESSGIHLGNTTKLTILKNASGIIKPSRMTLLLGPPSSGKTTLLLALAGKLDSSLKVKGDIKYNGHVMKEFVPQKTSAYISQDDVHVGEMTVKETLDFSARCQGVGSKYDLLTELSRREKEAGILPEAEVDLFMKATSMEGMETSLQTDYTLRILGLDICSETLVGDEMQRGISGGQKKRVTTGEMIVGPTTVLLMDEISTGLDSSTTFQIVKCLQQIVHLGEATIIISLLQPAPETFALFDDVILLSEGQVVYQGPRENILDFFEFCGFRCPERKGAADFLQEVTSRKDQEQYWFDRNTPYSFVPVSKFVSLYNEFHVGATLQRELAVTYDKSKSHPASLVYTKRSVPTNDLLRAVFSKEWLLIRRNSFVYIFKGIQSIFMAFIGATVFLRTTISPDSLEEGTLYFGALVFGLVMNMFNGISEMSFVIQRLPVFFKQRDLLFHPAWMFSLAKFVLTLPISVLESVVWTVCTYYTIGFAPQASRFFKQMLLTFLVQQMASGAFRAIGSVCRNLIIANSGGSLLLLAFFILGGFILPYDLIPVWWKWGHWCSPLGYGYKAISVNEFLAPRWMKQSNQMTGDETIGEEVLESLGVQAKANWFWIGAGALFGFIVLFNILFTLALTYLNPLGGKSSVISENEATEMEADQEDTKETPRIQIQRSRREMAQHERSLASSDGNDTREMMARRLGSRSNTANSNNNGGVAVAKKGMVLPFTPLAMSFNEVNYFVDMPAEMKDQGVPEDRLQLLREVTGAFRPGVLTALMGVSGAGKTTLMDVLAGRKTGGYVEGDIKISGYTKKQDTFARISGYCEQNDIHSPSVTVKESLIYSAFLRLPKEVSDDQKMTFVDEVIDLVELDNLKNAIVGLPGFSGLSTEQRKRLTIAVELVANPSIIFMDEPTSGLDARAAAIVMRTVRNTVDTGRTVVCTIHQPSIEIFEAFDELLLMKRGGQIIYFGPLGQHSRDIVNYFQSIPGVTKIKDKYNPATWMLEASSGAQEVRLGMDFADHYTNSTLYQRNKEIVKELSNPPPGSSDLYFPTKFSQNIWGQFKSCVWKQWWTYWRSPEYNLVRFFFTVICSLLLGSIFWQIGSDSDSSTKLQTIIGALYISVFFLGVNNCGGVQPIVSTERAVFYREKAAGMYSSLPYAMSQVLVEIPYILIQTIEFSLIVYPMVGFKWTVAKFFWFFYVSFFSFLYFTYYGMMTVSISPNHQIAAILAASFYALFNLFSGFFIPRPKIPKWWIWYYWICPMAWTVYGLIVSQFGDMKDMIIVPGRATQSIKSFLKDDYGYEEDFIGVVAVVLLAWPVFFAFIYSLCIKNLNFQSR